MSPTRTCWSPPAIRSEYWAAAPQRTQTAGILSTYSAIAMSSGIGPNGRRRKSRSSPATMTRSRDRRVPSPARPDPCRRTAPRRCRRPPRQHQLLAHLVAGGHRLRGQAAVVPGAQHVALAARVSVAMRNTWTPLAGDQRAAEPAQQLLALAENMPPVITSMQPPSPRPCSRITGLLLSRRCCPWWAASNPPRPGQHASMILSGNEAAHRAPP